MHDDFKVWTQVSTEHGAKMTLYPVLIGTKGDWVYLRDLAVHACLCMIMQVPLSLPRGKAHALTSGFTSTRKCHFCSSEATYLHSWMTGTLC